VLKKAILKMGVFCRAILFGTHLPPETIKQIIHMPAEGLGVRAIYRILDMYPHTINKVILRIGNHCAKKLTNLLKKSTNDRHLIRRIMVFRKKKSVIGKYNKKIVI
jgi:hypothetical protein